MFKVTFFDVGKNNARFDAQTETAPDYPFMRRQVGPYLSSPAIGFPVEKVLEDGSMEGRVLAVGWRPVGAYRMTYTHDSSYRRNGIMKQTAQTGPRPSGVGGAG